MYQCPNSAKHPRLEHVTFQDNMNSTENDEDIAGSSNLNERLVLPGTTSSVVSPDDNCAIHNDCSKKCNPVLDGARQVKHYNNISNGGDAQKVNNTTDGITCYRFHNGASTSRACTQNNDVDGYMRNNVDSPSDVEKCPSKVRNGSIDGSERRKFRRSRSSVDEESSSGNEGEEDCCVYTYKGSLQADLPSSFHILDRLANGIEQPGEEAAQEPPHEEHSRSQAGSSPDNEFLEMDFDPGPSLEDEDTDTDQVAECECQIPDLPCEQDVENDLSTGNENAESADFVNNVTERRELAEPEPQPGPSREPHQLPSLPQKRTLPSMPQTSWNAPSQRTWPIRDSWNYHCSSGDLCTPLDASEIDSGETLALMSASNIRLDGEGHSDTRKINLFSDLYHCIMAKRLVMDKNASFIVGKSESSNPTDDLLDETPPVDRTMIWSEVEACNKQVTQISTSACGATAVINVMLALNTPFALEKLKKGVGTRLRQESAPLPQYLLSRSSAGATHLDIIQGVEVASEGRLFSKFFDMYPERKLSLSKWLSYWMKKGAVPVATLNLQAGLSPESPLPDAWHHQMIFGVSPRGIFLTNPLECVPEGALLAQLCSPPILKVRRGDILQRWTSSTDLMPLMCQPDVRWKKLNVLGQVVNIVRESVSPTLAAGRTVPQYVDIPAAYASGITLVIPRDSPGYEQLAAQTQLPLLNP